ncbi:protein with metallophosphatase domain [Klebsormidium nitens]|uniref:Protein with metallophosphatase domain n=1 Tax=Klebsormidium nitens TaxID=105231 RepID=A0A1Y1IF04_KLENI|nr:protein with metallophosphatase domain [Klebsormidium nitens]|eukprot:GAQ87336.1 protein with metallophosphatase domain [Klebsormidium nitens]
MKEVRRYLRTLRGHRGPLLRTLCLMAGILGLLLYLTRHHHELHSTKPLYFVSIGDYGAGNATQQAVADQLAKTVGEYGVQFILTLGDNFYSRGVTSLEDPIWQKRFEAVYHHPSLQVPWYITLGDHDHRGNVSAQLLYTERSERWHLPSPYYLQQVALSEERHLDIVVTDSIALEGALAVGPKERRFFNDYTQQWVDAQAGKAHLDWLEATLANSTADWCIVAGHRPAKTAADRDRFRGDFALMEVLPPLLSRHSVDAYLSGHDHVGQHFEEGHVQFLGNGLGGYKTHVVSADASALWVETGFNGFLLHKVTNKELTSSFIDSEGRTRYTTKILSQSKRRAKQAGLRFI